jgi:uncharacterized membrane protein
MKEEKGKHLGKDLIISIVIALLMLLLVILLSGCKTKHHTARIETHERESVQLAISEEIKIRVIQLFSNC